MLLIVLPHFNTTAAPRQPALYVGCHTEIETVNSQKISYYCIISQKKLDLLLKTTSHTTDKYFKA